MNNRWRTTAYTFLKFLGWTALVAVLQQSANYVGKLHIPDVYVPIVASLLKSAATYCATQETADKPDA